MPAQLRDHLRLFTLFLLISGQLPRLVFLALMPLLIVQVVFAIGLGVTLGILNVFFRDVGPVLRDLPAVLVLADADRVSASILPARPQALMVLNPMTRADRRLPEHPRATAMAGLVRYRWPPCCLACCSAPWRCACFEARSGEMVDEL